MGHVRSVLPLERRYTNLAMILIAALAMMPAAMPLTSGAVDLPVYPPANPKASSEVRQILNRLKSLQGKVMVSGQTDLRDALWIEEQTGKLPVVLALDFMRVPRRMGAITSDTDTAIEWSQKRGGIVSFQWHWTSPTGAKDKESGFYTNSTTFDLAQALADPQSEAYRGLIEDIDDVAAQLKRLQEAKVPVIFRPLHEAQGKWFWWGAKGPEACVQLYRLMFNRLTHHHGLNHLMWAWTAYPASHQKGDPAAWYPGDHQVDFVVSDYCESPQDYADLVRLTDGRKMVALSETMNAPNPATALKTTPWAYWVTWARRDWKANSPDDLRTAMASPLTLNLATYTARFDR